MKNQNSGKYDKKAGSSDAGIQENVRNEDKIEGRNAVLEALKSDRTIDRVYIAEGDTDRALSRIAAIAKDRGAVIKTADRRKLDAMSETGAHQGVIAFAAAHAYATVDDILQYASVRNEAPLIVVCDEIADPHNLGAIIRSAECAGAHGVIIPKRRNVGLTAVVAKTSAGALEYMRVARVANLSAALQNLKKQGIWVFGTDASGDRDMYHADFTMPAAVVIGSEGFGMSRLVSDCCDFKISIPMRGNVNSLNASAAASVILFEALRQRTQSFGG